MEPSTVKHCEVCGKPIHHSGRKCAACLAKETK